MKLTLFLLFSIVGIVCISGCIFPKPPTSTVRWVVRKGLKAMLSGRRSSVAFKKLVKSLYFVHVFRTRLTGKRKRPKNYKMICVVCEETAGVIIEEARKGKDPEIITKFLVEVCATLRIEPREVCNGTIRLNVIPVLYIIENRPELTGEMMCALILQPFNCAEDYTDLDVNIPEGTTIDVKKGKRSKADPIKILHITDLHYDPHYLVGGSADCDEPLCCQVHKGLAKKSKYAAGYWGDYRSCDMPKHFSDDAFQQINKKHDDLDYIYYTGDVIGHRLWDTTKRNNTIYLREIFTSLHKEFPKIPIYPALGNHEPHPVNLFSPPSVTNNSIGSKWLYKEIAEMWSVWLPEKTKKTIIKGGYYTVLAKPGFRIIVLNSNVAFTYNWWILYETDTITEQLQWLADTLYKAEKKGEFVHILSHIPNGDDTLYIPYSRQFLKIVERFANTISAIYNGHSHWDEWLLYHSSTEPSKPIAIAWNGGSLTTFTDVNPNYKIYTVDGKNYEVLDFDSWTFNLTLANLTPKKSPKWYKQYSLKEAYKLKNLSPQEIRNLLERATRDHSVMEIHYSHRYRDADTRGTCNEKCMLKDLCRMVVMVHGELTQCNELKDMWD